MNYKVFQFRIFCELFLIFILLDINVERVKKATLEVLQDQNINRNKISATHVTKPMKIVRKKIVSQKKPPSWYQRFLPMIF